jgi:hypothetical protein
MLVMWSYRNMIINVGIPYMVENFLTSCLINSYSRRTDKGGSNSNVSCLYLGGTHFESWLGHWLSQLRFVVVFLSLFRQMQ